MPILEISEMADSVVTLCKAYNKSEGGLLLILTVDEIFSNLKKR